MKTKTKRNEILELTRIDSVFVSEFIFDENNEIPSISIDVRIELFDEIISLFDDDKVSFIFI